MEQQMLRIRELLKSNTIDVSDHAEIEENLKDIENVWNMAEIREKKMHTTIDNLKSDTETLKDDIVDFRAEIQQLEEDKSELESEVDDLKGQLAGTESERDEFQSELDQVKDTFKVESPIDEMKVEALQRLYKNCDIEVLERVEKVLKKAYPRFNKIYQDY